MFAIARLRDKVARIYYSPYLYDALFLCVLFIGFFLRLDAFRYPSYSFQSDYGRDYLIANHIVHYGEIPFTGPEGGIGTIVSSPFYFYLLSLWLFLKDDIRTLGFVNILLQLATLVLIYLLAKNMFGRGTALIAAVLFALARGTLSQSTFVWQPHIMQPFITLSCLLLLLSYQRRKFTLFLGSLCVFIFSTTLHLSTLAAAPLYFILAYLVIRRFGTKIRHYLFALAATLLAFIVFYFPPILYMYAHRIFSASSTATFSYVISQFEKLSMAVVWEHFVARGMIFLKFFFVEIGERALPIYFVGILLFLMLLYFFVMPVSSSRKRYAVLLLLSIVGFHLITVVHADISYSAPYPIRYFTPIFGIFIILIAEIINGFTFRNVPAVLLAKATFVMLLVGIFSPGLFRHSFGKMLWISHDPPLYSSMEDQDPARLGAASIFRNSWFLGTPYFFPPGYQEIKAEIEAIKRQEGRYDRNFFDFLVYKEMENGVYAATLMKSETLLVSLERELGVRLTRVDDDAIRGWSMVGDATYIFLRCDSQKIVTYQQCTEAFLHDYPGYFIVKNIVDSGGRFFLTRRV